MVGHHHQPPPTMLIDPFDSQAINDEIIQCLQDVIDAIKEGRWRVEEANGTGKRNATPGRHEYVLMVRLSCDSMAEHPDPEP